MAGPEEPALAFLSGELVGGGPRKRDEPLMSIGASIIILVHNHAKITLECLASITKYTERIPYEVIIVDNGSSPDESKILAAGLVNYRAQQCRIINFSKNLGFAKAANIAAAQGAGEFLVFLNNDTIVTKNWLLPLLTFMNQNPQVAACQPKIHSWLHKEYFDYAGGSGGYLDILGYPFTRGRVFDFVEKDLGQYDRPAAIGWASGVCLVVGKEVFDAVGGFDEYFFAYHEEIDLCLRLAQAGYKIYCLPTSLVYHLGAVTANANLPRKVFLNHNNSFYLILKHYSLWPYWPLIAARVFLDLAAIFYYLWQLQPAFGLAVLASFAKTAVLLPHFVKKRVVTFKGRNLAGNAGIFRGSIVFEYFFRGRRTFSEIMTGKKQRRVSHLDYRRITYFES